MKALSVAFLLVLVYLFSNPSPVASQSPTPSPDELLPGDIAIVGFAFDNPDEFTIAILKDIRVDTEIILTDRGWKNDPGNFVHYSGDTIFSYTIPAGTQAGTVKNFISSEETNNFDFNTTGDQIFVYTQIGNQLSHVIFGLNSSGVGWQPDCFSATTSALPPELSSSNSIAINHFDNGYFPGRSFPSPQKALEDIVNQNNWIKNNERLNLPLDPFQFVTTHVKLSEFKISQTNESLIVLLGAIICVICILLGVRERSNSVNQRD